MLNQCSFIGRLGNDPETKFAANGNAITNISVACGEKWKDKDGQQQERTEWVRATGFGRLAEIMGEYLKKGSLVYISGKMKTDKYTDKDGIEKYSTNIIVNDMKMLSPKSENAAAPQQPAPQVTQVDNAPDMDDDIPFS